MEKFLELDNAVAAADLRTKQFYGVKIDSTGKINVATAAKNILGVLQDKPNTGETGTFARPGSISKVAIAASQVVAIGGLLEITTGGTFIPVASGTAVARAREALASVAAVKIIHAELLWSNALDT